MWLMKLKCKIKYDRAAGGKGIWVNVAWSNKTDAKISASNGI